MSKYYKNGEELFKDFDQIELVEDLRFTLDGKRMKIDIIGVREDARKLGVARNLLKHFKKKGFEVCPHLPVEDAMPFWRKMFKEGLIVCNPDELEKYNIEVARDKRWKKAYRERD